MFYVKNGINKYNEVVKMLQKVFAEISMFTPRVYEYINVLKKAEDVDDDKRTGRFNTSISN